MSKADRKELKDDLSRENSVPEDQHCQKCGQVKDSVVTGEVNGYDYLCEQCLKEEVDNQ
ncbi:MAG: hypothetical protein ABEJ56_00060 [Candidatus Nanohaloarchaea archaeon]